MTMNRLRSQVGVSVLLACALGVYSSGSGGNVQQNYAAAARKGQTKFLHRAIQNRDISAIRTAIKKGADVNCAMKMFKEKEKRTPLNRTLSCFGMDRFYSIEPFKLLLDKGADPDDFEVLWMLFGYSGNAKCRQEILELLCRYNVDLCSPDSNGLTILHRIILKEATDTTALRILGNFYEHVNVGIADSFGPILYHNYRGELNDEKEILVQSVPSGSTPLHVAAWNGRLNAVTYLCEQKNADANLIDGDGCTSLHRCCLPTLFYNAYSDCNITSNTEKSKKAKLVADTLIGVMENDRINLKDNEGKTALHLAAKYNRTGIVRLLLNQNADINLQDNTGWTPLHYAALNGHLGVVEELCERGANIHSQNVDQETPLHLAREKDHRDIVAFLTDFEQNHGVALPPAYSALTSETEQAKSGETHNLVGSTMDPRDAEIARLREQLAQEQEKRVSTSPPYVVSVATKTEKNQLLEAVLFGDNDQTTALLNTGTFTADARDERSYTLLHIAAEQGNSELCNTLLFHGAPVNAMVHEGARRGWTPLHFAVARKNHELVQIFLNASAFPSIPDSKGDTPLHWAVSRQDVQITQLLIDAGGRPDAPNGKGKTPLSFAQEKENTELVALLEQHMPEQEEQGVRCCICQDSLGPEQDQSFVVARECGHVIHIVCSEDVIDCPVCREALGPDSWQRLYFEV